MGQRIHTAEIYPEAILSRSVAVIGYGNQGRAQALNLRDSGVNVTIGQRPGKSFDRALEDGFAPVTASKAAECDVLMLTLPDEFMGEIFESEILPVLVNKEAPNHRTSPERTLLFSHGFAIRFGTIIPPEGVYVALVSPKGAAVGVRGLYLEGKGVPALIAVETECGLQPVSGSSSSKLSIGREGSGGSMGFEIALAYAWACGYSRAALYETTFAEETETDLFGEQVVLCGGMIELIKAGFETLVEAGYSPEAAYFECVQETKLIIDLLVARGLTGMREAISDTAEYGGYAVGPTVITEESRAQMKLALTRIQSGDFAREWLEQAKTGKPALNSNRKVESDSQLERIANQIRS